MEIKKVLKTKDGNVTFKGSLSPEEHEFVLAVGLNTLMENGAIPFQVGEEDELAYFIPGETPVQQSLRSMKILYIPDCQIKPGVDVSYLSHIGQYIVEKQPDVIVNAGDFADMPSLSSYDVGKKSFEGRRYKSDIEAAHQGMEILLAPIKDYNYRMRKARHKAYLPRYVLTLGNHEERINKAVNNDAKLEGVLSVDDLKYKEFGWEVFPFLDVVVVNGVAFSHYFCSGPLGRPCSSAAVTLNKKHMSTVAGHQQGLQISMAHTADGRRLTSIIAGSCYTHDEDYMGPQGNKHWRGVLMLHDVHDGEFDVMPVSLKFLKEKYGR